MENTATNIPQQQHIHRRIGYARVSTAEQNLDLQIDALQKAGCDVIYQEKGSGKNSDRPELMHTMMALRPGDSLVVWRLDRLSRSLSDLIKIVNELDQKEIHFESITEKIDTGSAAGKLTLHIFGALAEFERNVIKERTRAGLEAARARGRKGGRKKKLTEKQVKEIKTLVKNPEILVSDVARRYGISRTTLYKYIKD